MTAYDYAEQFAPIIEQKYAKELTSYDLFQSNPQVKFIDLVYSMHSREKILCPV